MRRPADLFACGLSCLLLVLANTAAHQDARRVPAHAHVIESKSPYTAPAFSPRARHHKQILASVDAR